MSRDVFLMLFEAIASIISISITFQFRCKYVFSSSKYGFIYFLVLKGMLC